MPESNTPNNSLEYANSTDTGNSGAEGATVLTDVRCMARCHSRLGRFAKLKVLSLQA